MPGRKGTARPCPGALVRVASPRSWLTSVTGRLMGADMTDCDTSIDATAAARSSLSNAPPHFSCVLLKKPTAARSWILPFLTHEPDFRFLREHRRAMTREAYWKRRNGGRKGPVAAEQALHAALMVCLWSSCSSAALWGR